ncbi:MAG TPA: TIGR04086 family membrane protein [Candidatus Binatia bacterium]|nr:TIGR04086 family membrane protein [Candidatus Binatia bacterium]
MEYGTRPNGKPPPPVEPTGFFTGVQIRPIIVGVVVDYIATYAGIYTYFFIYLAEELSKQGEVTEEQIRNYMLSPEGLMVGFTIGVLATALGGFVAARQAGKLEIKHGALVGFASLILSFVEQSLQEESVPLPEWFRFLSIAAIIPAGALGGYLAEAFKGVAASYRQTGGSFPET